MSNTSKFENAKTRVIYFNYIELKEKLQIIKLIKHIIIFLLSLIIKF